jgi:multiple sugar transport system substrate-binding protein
MGILRARQAPAAAGRVTIRYWTWQNSADTKNPRAQAQAQFLGAFRKANPDIELIEEVVPWQQIFHQLLQAAAANKAPDVSKQLDRFVRPLADAGAILPLDEFTSSWSPERRNDYVYAWDDTAFDGRKFAFRHAVRPVNIMYYRKDLYEAAGFKTPPKTAKELTEMSKAVTKGNIIGYIEPFSKSDLLAKFILIAPPHVLDPRQRPNGPQDQQGYIPPGGWTEDLPVVSGHGVCPQGLPRWPGQYGF